MKTELARGGEHARAVLQELFPQGIVMELDRGLLAMDPKTRRRVLLSARRSPYVLIFSDEEGDATSLERATADDLEVVGESGSGGSMSAAHSPEWAMSQPLTR